MYTADTSVEGRYYITTRAAVFNTDGTPLLLTEYDFSATVGEIDCAIYEALSFDSAGSTFTGADPFLTAKIPTNDPYIF